MEMAIAGRRVSESHAAERCFEVTGLQLMTVDRNVTYIVAATNVESASHLTYRPLSGALEFQFHPVHIQILTELRTLNAIVIKMPQTDFLRVADLRVFVFTCGKPDETASIGRYTCIQLINIHFRLSYCINEKWLESANVDLLHMPKAIALKWATSHSARSKRDIFSPHDFGRR